MRQWTHTMDSLASPTSAREGMTNVICDMFRPRINFSMEQRCVRITMDIKFHRNNSLISPPVASLEDVGLAIASLHVSQMYRSCTGYSIYYIHTCRLYGAMTANWVEESPALTRVLRWCTTRSASPRRENMLCTRLFVHTCMHDHSKLQVCLIFNWMMSLPKIQCTCVYVSCIMYKQHACTSAAHVHSHPA